MQTHTAVGAETPVENTRAFYLHLAWRHCGVNVLAAAAAGAATNAIRTHTPSTPRYVVFSLFEAPASKVLCWHTRQCDSWLRLGPFYPASTHIPRPCAKSHGARGRYRPDGHFHRGFVPFHRGFVFPRRYTEQPWPAHGPTQWLSPLTHPREGAPRALTTSCECRPPG